MRTITKTAIIIRLVFLFSIISAGLIASVMEDSKAEQKAIAQQNQEVITVMHSTVKK